MATISLGWLTATERKRTALVTLLLGLGIAFTFIQALLQRAYLTSYDYLLALAICLVAGAVLADLAKALLSYLAALTMAVVIILSLLILPSAFGELPPPGDVVVSNLWIIIVFNSIFPFPIIGFLLATFLGAFLGEQYF